MAGLRLVIRAVCLLLCLLIPNVFAHPSLFAGSDDVSVTSNKFSIDAHRNPRYQPNPQAEYQRAVAKFGSQPPGFLPGDKQVGDIDAYNQTYDREWLSPVAIGTPPQNLMIDLDSGSADLWVFSSETRSNLLGNRSIYHPDQSSSAKQSNSAWNITYGDQSAAFGKVWTDVVNIGGIQISNAAVESATMASTSLIEDPVLSGLLGLAIGLNSRVYPPMPSVQKQLWPLLDQPLFTVDLHWKQNGSYDFGHIDGGKYSGDVHYTPLSDDPAYWEFTMSGINVDGSRIWMLSSWPAILDTGTTLLLLEPGLAGVYWNLVPSATNTSLGTGEWTFDCNETLPDLNLGFKNIDGWYATVPGKFINYTALPDGSCYGGVQGNGGLPFSILGDILLKSLFAIFDVGGARIGFADKPNPV